jgi:hypothetical protein
MVIKHLHNYFVEVPNYHIHYEPEFHISLDSKSPFRIQVKFVIKTTWEVAL